MSRLQTPRIAGVSGGVGTTTLATALRAHDRGRQADRGIEVLACRCTGESLHRAATIVNRLASHGKPRPVLAVTADLPGSIRGPLRARLRMIEPQVAELVLLPYVGRWRELTDPLVEVAQLLPCSDDLPRSLRGYTSALRELAQAIVRSGQLEPIAAAGRPGHGPTGQSGPIPIGSRGGSNQSGPIHSGPIHSGPIHSGPIQSGPIPVGAGPDHSPPNRSSRGGASRRPSTERSGRIPVALTTAAINGGQL